MTTLISLLLVGLIETGSVGFMHDPLVDGVSVKMGAVKGLRGNFMISFGSGEAQVDSSAFHNYITPSTIYDTSFYRPYFWINYGLRAEYHFTHHEWYQTYLGLGVEGKKESRWYTGYDHNYYDSINTNFPVKSTADYFGPTLSAGIDFFPIALFAKAFNSETRFGEVISFNVEICSYYLFKHEFNNTSLTTDWYDFGYYPEHAFSGIGTGIGIQYNW